MMIDAVTRKEFDEVAECANEALRLASKHDPDLLKRIEELEKKVNDANGQ